MTTQGQENSPAQPGGGDDAGSMMTTQEKAARGRSQDAGGIGRGDHFLPYKFIERTIERKQISQNNF